MKLLSNEKRLAFNKAEKEAYATWAIVFRKTVGSPRCVVRAVPQRGDRRMVTTPS